MNARRNGSAGPDIADINCYITAESGREIPFPTRMCSLLRLIRKSVREMEPTEIRRIETESPEDDEENIIILLRLNAVERRGT